MPILVAPVCFGQAAIPLDRFEPAVAGSRLFALDDPQFTSSFGPRLGVVMGYSHRPLVIAGTQQGSEEVRALVDHQLTVHALAAVEILQRILLEADVPVTLSQGGESAALDQGSFRSPKGGRLNDLRIGARFGILRQQGPWPAAALGITGWLPTGDEESYAGSSKARLGINFVLGSESKRALWRVSIGRRRQAFSPAVQTARSDWAFAAGAAWKLGGFQLGPEVFGATANDTTVEPFTAASTGFEALLGARQQWGDWAIAAAAGPGLSEAPGTPKFRCLLGVSWTPRSETEPRAVPQGETLTTASTDPDATPVGGRTAAVAATSGTLEGAADTDGDGVLDAADDCPNALGDPGAAPPRRGCPTDTDADGIVDTDDRCPAQAGVPSDDPQRFGCPADSDGDGIIDEQDACPQEHGPTSDDPKLNGCKPAIVVKGQQFVLVDQIHFETGNDAIAQESFQVLAQIASLMNEHEEIARVAVDGHTDDVGRETDNLALSRRRAISVVRWLIDHGVDERRLEARGFGPRRPLAENSDEPSRARNRRVEFHVLKRTALGRDGWKDGPVDD